jgi:two-component system alkaline phosphatase synthesis response regulator PhoP
MIEISKILLVDDEIDILEFLSYNLKKEGFIVDTCNNGKSALKKVSSFNPDLVILDVMMPEMDGIEVCEKIREKQRYDDILILFLTARSEDYSELAGFSAGADDYITKPIRPKVLLSRVKALLSRKSSSNSSILEYGELKIDEQKYLVVYNEKELSLPKKEFKLLVLLCSKPGHVFTRQEILNDVWGTDVFVGDRTIDVHIRKLREKINSDYFKTVKGVGYKFQY